MNTQRQDCHTRAWAAVGAFLKTSLTVFGGKLTEAESTTMPEVRQWIKGAASEMGNAIDDHCIILVINCPSMGILGATAKSFLLSFIANTLADHPENAIALLVHPNRASQQEGRTISAKQTNSVWNQPQLYVHSGLKHLVWSCSDSYDTLLSSLPCQEDQWRNQGWRWGHGWHQSWDQETGDRWWRWWGQGREKRQRGGSDPWCSIQTWESSLIWEVCHLYVRFVFTLWYLWYFHTGSSKTFHCHTLLRKDLSIKERGLKMRQVTWIFEPVTCHFKSRWVLKRCFLFWYLMLFALGFNNTTLSV